MVNIKVAMVSDVPPDPSYTAGQVLDKIIENALFADFDFYWLNQSNLPPTANFSYRCHLKKTILYNCGKNSLIIKGLFRLAKNFQRIEVILKILIGFSDAMMVGLRLGLLLRKSSYDIVWMVLQGERLAVTYYFIQIVCGKKTILHQWDPVEWWMEHHGHDGLFRKVIKGVVTTVEKRAVLNIVPSNTWRQLHLDRGLKAVRVDNFFRCDELDGFKARAEGPEEVFNAVFLGQLYSNNELKVLVAKLKAELNSINKLLILHYFGASQNVSFEGIQVVCHGFLSRDKLVSEISQWDLALLPYPTDGRFDSTSRLSFPSKSRVYLAAGLPILAYCHLNSSPQLFFDRVYREHFHNVFNGGGMRNFLAHSLEKPVRSNRQVLARGIVGLEFSLEAELDVLREAILVALNKS